jgi:hypothetical protein
MGLGQPRRKGRFSRLFLPAILVEATGGNSTISIIYRKARPNRFNP